MKFSDIKFERTKSPDGVQALLDFGPYELSIICNEASYGHKSGLFEIAVFRDDELIELPGITEDGDTVKGYLTQFEVEATIKKMFLISAKGPVQRQVEAYATT